MSFYALVLSPLNTANFQRTRTSRRKVHAHRRELFRAYCTCRSLGGNLKGKQALERLHAFLCKTKIMQKKYVLLFLLLIASSLLAFSENALRIHTKSGNDVTILLEELPIVTFLNEDIVVATQMNEIHYSASEITKFTYTNVSISGIDENKKIGTLFVWGENDLKAFNLSPQTNVSLYTIEGKLVACGKTNSKGYIHLSFTKSAKSVYILKSESITFKIYKR